MSKGIESERFKSSPTNHNDSYTCKGCGKLVDFYAAHTCKQMTDKFTAPFMSPADWFSKFDKELRKNYANHANHAKDRQFYEAIDAAKKITTMTPTNHNDSQEKPNLLLLQILADYSNDLHTLSKRDGKTPAEAAVQALQRYVDEAVVAARIECLEETHTDLDKIFNLNRVGGYDQKLWQYWKSIEIEMAELQLQSKGGNV